MYTATDFCPDSSSRLQRRQYKFSKGPSPAASCDRKENNLSRPDWTQVCRKIRAYWEHESENQAVLYPEASGLMHSVVVGAGESLLTIGRSRDRTHERPGKSRSPSQLGTQRCEQVAAVCYRVRSAGIEFLLVRARRGRWTFPKGGVEPRLTRAQAAALEAFEEAGVHGRIEEASFARYSRKRGNMRGRIVVHAYLCEVLGLDAPQEGNRNRTWFSPDKARRCLREDRTPYNGAELALVVDRAVARIQRLRSGTTAAADALQKVQFEARERVGALGRTEDTAFIQYIRRKRGQTRDSAPIEFTVNSYLREVLRLNENTARLTLEKARRRLNTRHAPHYAAGT